jgi:phospholipid/cholesterol/gamma-HCH transport system substrate-binding protein
MPRLRLVVRRPLAATIAVLTVAALTSCASISVNNLPQPGTTYRGGYDIVLEFANVLNLPDRAKVVMDGTTVGVVEKVALSAAGVDVTARIDPSVEIPSDVHAVLQQATVLVDTSKSATEQQHSLTQNGRIPLAQTTSPPQLEDTIANLANFVGSGSIQRIQNTIININRVTPEHTEQVRAIVYRVSTDLADLSDNVDTADIWLSGLADTADLMAKTIPQFNFWFSPTGMQAFDFSTRTGTALATVIPSVGSIFAGGYWLVPLLDSMANAFGSIQQAKQAIEAEYRPWRQLFTDTFLPADKYPAMNIISVQTPDGREISQNVQDVLRMLGAVP